MARFIAVALLVAIAFSATSCRWTAAELGAGAANQSAQAKPPAHWGAHLRNWQRMLRTGATHKPTASYPTPSRYVLLQRLQQTSSRYGFGVVSVRILHAPQGAPQVIIQAGKTSTFARSVPAIMRVLDPNHRAAEDWLGWAYEGFFLGVQDSHGNPFLAVFNTMRLHSGGQWARSDPLFPYPHG